VTSETKTAAVSPEIKAAQGDLLSAFEAFKRANDQRLAELERKSTSDPLLEDKIRRIDSALVEQKTAIDRLAMSGARPILDRASAG